MKSRMSAFEFLRHLLDDQGELFARLTAKQQRWDCNSGVEAYLAEWAIGQGQNRDRFNEELDCLLPTQYRLTLDILPHDNKPWVICQLFYTQSKESEIEEKLPLLVPQKDSEDAFLKLAAEWELDAGATEQGLIALRELHTLFQQIPAMYRDHLWDEAVKYPAYVDLSGFLMKVS